MKTPRWSVLLLLGALYFCQGLPFGFFVQALPVVLRKQGLSLEQVGLASLLALPWAVKFLWSPAVDRYGTRRGWILVHQGVAVAVFVALALFVPANAIAALMVATFITNLLSASQDVATDGLAVRLLPEEDRGLANGLQVGAYRVGMIVGGGGLLMTFEWLGWRGTFGVMAAVVAVATIPVLLSREPPRLEHQESQASLQSFFRQPGAWTLIAGLLVYKAGEAAGTGMLRPFMVDRGYELADVGFILGTVGFVAGLLGALFGGAVAGRRRRLALYMFAVTQAIAVAAYGVVALLPPSRELITGVVALEHFTSGTATVSLFTAMMDRCRPEAASTDYTVQASAVVIATAGMSALSGFGAAHLGYAGNFFASAALAVLALVVVGWIAPAREA